MYRVIGQPIPRSEMAGKATGEARYTADVRLPGTLWAKVLRSTHSHARIIRIDTSRARQAPGVHAVVTGADVRGILYGRRYRDLSVLAQDKVRFLGERVAAVAAESPEAARAAAALISVDYEELPAVFDPVAAMAEGAPIIHPDVNDYPGLPEPLARPGNAYVCDVLQRGDVAKGFADSDMVVENTFTVPRVHQAFLEPHSCLVWLDDNGVVQVWSSSKAPHVLKQSLAVCLSIARERIRINPVSIGGDFGGKGGALDEPLCYFLALRSGRPVKMVMEYQEELTAGAPRHAAVIRMKTGVKRNGTLVAHQMDAVFDSGAYGGFRPGPSFAGAAHAGGCYRAPNAYVMARRVYTNNIPGGQMRAPGDPQAFFAAESQVDCVARALAMDPLEFRRKNLIEDGDETITGARYLNIRAQETLEAAVKAGRYEEVKAPNVGRGIAMGYRAPGGGASALAITLDPGGPVTLQTAAFEQGSGTYTTLKQVLAEELGIDPEVIEIRIWNTDEAPFDSGIGGSRGTRITTGSAFQAAQGIKSDLLDLAQELLGWPRKESVIEGREVVWTRTGERQPWDSLLSRHGRPLVRQAVNQDSSAAPVTAFTAQVAEVSVDTETGEVKLLAFTTAHDTGTIMNPIGHQGQIEGAVIQGVGYGLTEQLLVADGRVGTLHFGDYKIPNVKDIPQLKTVILESQSGVGPYNIKGIGENPISPVAPAIANAVYDAVGVRIRDLPIMAEKILLGLNNDE